MAAATCPYCGGALNLVKAESASAAHDDKFPDHWAPVTKTVTCNRCGATELAWLKGRNGKPYLAQARRLPDGRLGADRREFHQCPGSAGQSRATAIDRTTITDEDIPF